MSLSIIHIIDIVIYNYIDIVKCPRVLQSNNSLYTSNNSYIAKYNIQNRLINNTLINFTVYPTAFIQNDFLLLQSTGQSIQSTTSLNVTLFNRFNGCTATSPSCNPNRPCLLYTKSCPKIAFVPMPAIFFSEITCSKRINLLFTCSLQ